MEIWKSILGYPKYSVSNTGRVRRKYKTYYLILSFDYCRGYPQVTLYDSGIKYKVSVHHLVLEAFVGPRPAGYLACHKNDIRTDNRIENLYWGSRKNNAQDALKNGGACVGETSHYAKLTETEVLEIRDLYPTYTILELARKYNVTKSTISYVVNRKTWKHI